MRKKILFSGMLISLVLLGNALKAQDDPNTQQVCGAAFTYEINNLVDLFAPGIALNFFDQSKGDKLKYFWDFGDGITSDDQNPMHAFNFLELDSVKPLKREAKVCLTVYNDACKNNVCMDVPLYADTDVTQPSCYVWFDYGEIPSAGTDSGTFKTYQFKADGGNDVAVWTWDFGDSTAVHEQYPVHNLVKTWNPNYKAFGTMVTAYILTADSCKTSFSQFVMWKEDANAGCNVAFKYFKNDSVVEVPEQSTLHFITYTGNDASVPPGNNNDVVSWRWDFGDGTTSGEENPVHTFKTPAIDCFKADCASAFYVCETITTASGCTSSYCDYVNPSGNHTNFDCEAKFSYTMTKSIPPIYSFSNVSKWHSGKSFWSFGDGTFSYEENPVHVFNAVNTPADSAVTDVKDNNRMIVYHPGNQLYTVCLTISDETGCTSSYCESIYAYTDTQASVCNNFIKISTTNILAANSCKGTALAELVDGNGVALETSAFYWSTGETAQKIENLCPGHIYKISIVDKNGCYNTGSFAINDYGNSNPNMGNWNYEGKDAQFIFHYMGTETGLNYEWNFSDGTKTNGADVPHVFSATANNWVELVVTDGAGNELYREMIMLPAGTTNVNNPTAKSKVTLYPNPVTDKLHIDMQGNAGKVVVEILDISGRVTAYAAIKGSAAEIDLNFLSNGLYLCKLKSGTSVIQTLKFIKK